MTRRSRVLKCRFALNSIARRYPVHIAEGYGGHCVMAFLGCGDFVSDADAPGVGRRVAPCGVPEQENMMASLAPELDMTSLSPADAERLRLAFLQCRDMDGTLKQQLEAYAAAGREIFPAYGAAVDRLVARIHENGGGENAPRPGDVMPPFMLPDDDGRLVGLESLLAAGPLAVMFFRGHWCPYCRLNVRAVIQAQDRIRAAGGHTVAIMPELQPFTRKFKADSGARFPVLTDLDNGYALSLNLAIWL